MEFKLPDIGEGLTEGEVTRWLVNEGDVVKENQPMVEVMTDKATVEITSPRAGRIGKIHVAAGKTVPIGTVLVVIEEAAGSAPAPASHGHGHGSAAAPAARPAAAPAMAAAAGHGNGAAANGGRVLAAPAARKKARELGVDLRTVPPTGPRGRVLTADVTAFAQGGGRPAAAAAAARPAPGWATAPTVAMTRPVAAPVAAARPAPVSSAARGALEERIPLRGLRKKIAEHLVHSKHTAPHYTYVEELDATELVKLRLDAKATAEAKGVKLTFLPFIVKAVVSGLREFPLLNASLDDAAGEIVLKRYYNIGIAADTPDGLMVPVVKDCDRRSIFEIAAEIQRVTEAARNRTSAIEDLRDGTFTITSAGSIGGVLATPIINHPDVAIMGVHKIKETPVVRDGQIVIRQMCYLSLSLDHRVVDGAVAAHFMNHVVKRLEKPGLMLLES